MNMSKEDLEYLREVYLLIDYMWDGIENEQFIEILKKLNIDTKTITEKEK